MKPREYRRFLAQSDPTYSTLAASHLAREGVRKRREDRKAFHRRMRAELGLPPAPAFSPTLSTSHTETRG